MSLHDLEEAVVDAAILRPEMTFDLAGIVQPDDFADPYLGAVFSVTVDMSPHTGRYDDIDDELRARGIHGPDDIHRLYQLRGPDVRLPTSEAEVYAALVADTSRRRKLAVTIAAAATALQSGADTDALLTHLRAGIGAA